MKFEIDKKIYMTLYKNKLIKIVLYKLANPIGRLFYRYVIAYYLL